MEILEKTECNLCFKDFKDDPEHIPKIMKCGDSFCAKCLKSLIIEDKINCPICKTVITEKIDEMPINKYALNPKKTIVCDICLEEYSNDLNSQKAPRIMKCGDTFCTECLEKNRCNNKNICVFCGEESCEPVRNLIINKCVIEKYEKEVILNFQYMDNDKEISDINQLDYTFSVGLMGESAGGKTSIAHYFYTGSSYGPNMMTTVGFDYHFKFVSCKDKLIKITLWDTAGQEKFGSLSAGYLRGVQALLLVFSLTPIWQDGENKKYKEAKGEEKLKIRKEYTLKTFNKVSFWLTQFNSFNKQENKIIYLIGNKCDDVENRIIKLEDAKTFAKDNKLKYFETSAITGRNIKKVFESLTLKLMEIYPCEARHSTKNFILGQTVEKERKKDKCC
jgi:GTPase SAR1 family protein